MKKLILYIGLFSMSFVIKAQISHPIAKPQWNEASNALSSNAPIQIEKPDLQAIFIEDSINALDKHSSWRFGYAIDRNVDVIELANREEQNGMLKFSLQLNAEDAKSLNFNFNLFHLSENSLLYFTSLDAKDQIGAITAANNKIDNQFSTRPIKGSAVLIELFVPISELEEVDVEISQVIYGYRDFFGKGGKTFNSSGGCNVNINCPEADLWQDVRRSVVLITASDNQRLCTGTLVNNVREDSIPYLLTASHCMLATNSIFIFNYENSSGNCQTNADGSLANSISGAISRAENPYSDFKLFELSQTPPLSYNPYYAGWDATGVPAYESTTIHHPSGDIKKFSQDYDTVQSSFFLPQNQNTHWQVGNWELGTTEIGSSGSALFDQNKRVVGQLEGGSANCSNNLNDYFGKFSVSWNYAPATNRQLKYWLDPDTTNTLVLDAMDAVTKASARDAELIYVSAVPSFSCDSTIDPVVHFLNRGNDTITSLTIEYGVNQQFNQSINWTGSLSTDEVEEFSLPSLQLSVVDSSFQVRLVQSADQDSTNNLWSKDIRVNPDPVSVAITFKSDRYGYENSWEILDSQNLVVAKGGPYLEAINNNGMIYRDSICLFDGCFQLKLYDAFGDGFNGPYWGSGYFMIQNRIGDTLVFENNFTTAQKNINFCASKNVSLLEYSKNEIAFSSYPNPVKAGEQINIKSQLKLAPEIIIFDLQGRIVQRAKGNTFRLKNNISPGVYIIQLNDQNQKIGRTKLLVQ